MAEVAHLFRCLTHRVPMVAHDEIVAIKDRGFAGCAHARPGGRRQVLWMDVETLDQMGLAPGALKENITTRGIDIRVLEAGERLRVGEALFEVTYRCDPCDRMEEIRPGLKAELLGRRGMLFRVIEGGRIRVGDSIQKVQYSAVAG
jgi:MOSC domain-containing protein YiiM